MKPGDLVTVNAHGIGRVVEAYAGGSVLVDLRDGAPPRRWSSGSVKPVRRVVGPRGVAKVNERAAQAAELLEQGLTYLEIAKRLGAPEHTVRAMLARVREAAQEARNRRYLG